MEKLSIRFEFVGNGDCIIIEWEGDDGPQIGVVDCNSSDRPNPVVQRLEQEEYDQVKFVVMSHPHHDHFSGLLPVLEYCESEEIPIGFFAYTTREVPSYLRSLALSNNESDDLADIFRLMRRIEEDDLLTARGVGTDQTKAIEMGGGVKMEFLAPSEKEKDKFAQTLYEEDDGELKIRDKPNANLVSSVLMIHSDDWHLLLTSDAEKSTLKRIGLSRLYQDYRPLRLGQIPHHGSEFNHYKEFWRKRQHSPGTPSPISVGGNPYGHPSNHVIDEMEDRLDYKVHTTGEVEQVNESEISSDLDLISEVDDKSTQLSSNVTLVYRIDPTSTDLPELETISHR